MSTFRFSTEVRVRLPETDAMGVVFHGYFFTYMEVGRMDYLRNLGLADGRATSPHGRMRPIPDFENLVARASCNFRSPARFDDLLVVRVRIGHIGRTSFRFDFRIEHKFEGRVVAEGEAVHVVIDDDTWQPTEVPRKFREIVRAFEGDSLHEAEGNCATSSES